MLAFFTIPQTGQESKETWQSLHEQRCLQGRNTTHEFLKLQLLQTIFSWFSLSPSPCPLFSPVPSSLSPLKHDPVSSTSLVKHPFSLSCSIVLFKFATIASFSVANRYHVWLSISTFLKKSSSSIVLFIAFAISSSFCCSKTTVFSSYFLKSNAICCLRCSCKSNLNLSFCFPKQLHQRLRSFIKTLKSHPKKTFSCICECFDFWPVNWWIDQSVAPASQPEPLCSEKKPWIVDNCCF